MDSELLNIQQASEKVRRKDMRPLNMHHITGAILFGAIKAQEIGSRYVITKQDLKEAAERAALIFEDNNGN